MRDRILRVPARVFGLAAAPYCGMIFGLSALPGTTFGAQTRASTFFFNACHAPLYSGLALLVSLALVDRRAAPRYVFARPRAALAVLLTMLYALADEWHQSFVAGRSPDLLDVLTDLGGATFAALAVSLLVDNASRRSVIARVAAMGGCVLFSASTALVATLRSAAA